MSTFQQNIEKKLGKSGNGTKKSGEKLEKKLNSGIFIEPFATFSLIHSLSS